MKDSPNARRKFLKNTSLLALSAGLIPSLLKGESNSAVVDPQACDKTTLDFYGEGPFYTANAPVLQNGQLASSTEPGSRMIISGRVMNLDCTEAIQNASIDIWQADDAGAYDNAGFKLRGKTATNSQGFYQFETVKPGKYLNGNTFRPSHIHFKISATGFPELITQLYFQGDLSIPGDAAASISSGNFDASARIIPLTTNTQNVLEGTWDIVIDAQGSGLGQSDIHLNNGMIYSASPNPFSDTIEIRYGVFKNAKASLNVYDLQGQLVANLEEEVLEAEKYVAIWEPPLNLKKGYYFISLQINQLQVHYLKILKI